MNYFIKTILILFSTIALFSCNDEFVNEKLTISGVATSAIVISPDWEASDYQFKCTGVKEADFTISSKPEWLVLDTNSGKFTDSIATIHASVIAEPSFSNTGFYVDQMIIHTGGKTFAVPVYYITEGNPVAQVNREFNFVATDYSSELHISNSGDGILLWDVVSMPDWLTVNSSQFNPASVILAKGYGASLPLTFNIQAAVQSNMKGTIVLKTNDKNNPMIEIAVTANLGNPNLSLSDRAINLGSTVSTYTSRIYNYGSGILVWNFEGLPDWLSVSKTGGTVMPYTSSNDFTFTCNRSVLQPGLNTATFYLKSNDADEPAVAITVTVRVPGIGTNIKIIEGNIVDVTFDKSTNTLYYVTGVPNKLVAYDVTNRIVLHEAELSKTPTCLSVDEDFKKALIGFEGSISTVDLSSFQVSKTNQLSTTVYDVEWATNGWFCYTNANSTANLLWINSNTGETYQTPNTLNSYLLGTADLKKIAHKPYLIASRKGVSPSGIFVYDLNTKTLKSYTHSSLSNIWFYQQGDSAITGISTILRTSFLTSVSGNQIQSPSYVGELKISDYRNATWWADYDEANHSIWAIFSTYTFTYSAPVKGKIYQFEDNSYTLAKTYTFDYLFQPDAQTTPYEVEARYVFANSAGTELSVLRKAVNSNSWSIEFMPVQ